MTLTDYYAGLPNDARAHPRHILSQPPIHLDGTCRTCGCVRNTFAVAASLKVKNWPHRNPVPDEVKAAILKFVNWGDVYERHLCDTIQ